MKPLLPLNDFLNTPDFWMLLLCNAFMGEDGFRELIESMKNEETSDMLEKGKVIIMGPERRVVKEWLKTVDREELDAMLQAAIFTPDEQKYIRMRLIEGMTFKEIAIDQSLTRKSVARIARRISKKMYKSGKKLGYF